MNVSAARQQQQTSAESSQGQEYHFDGKLLQLSFTAPTPASRSNSSCIHPRTSIHPRFSSRLPTLHFFSPSPPTLTALSPRHCLPPVFSSTFAPCPFTKPVGFCSRYTRLLSMGNRWRNSPIWHATRPKCGRCGSELRSAQCATLFSSYFITALTVPFLFNPMRSLVDSYQPLISSITSTFQTRMSSANYVLSSSPGGINHGRAKCVVRRPELENFSRRETISTRQTSTFPVRRLSRRSSSSLLKPHFSYGICDIYPPGCLTVRFTISFPSRNLRCCCDKGNRRPHT